MYEYETWKRGGPPQADKLVADIGGWKHPAITWTWNSDVYGVTVVTLADGRSFRLPRP